MLETESEKECLNTEPKKADHLQQPKNGDGDRIRTYEAGTSEFQVHLLNHSDTPSENTPKIWRVGAYRCKKTTITAIKPLRFVIVYFTGPESSSGAVFCPFCEVSMSDIVVIDTQWASDQNTHRMVPPAFLASPSLIALLAFFLGVPRAQIRVSEQSEHFQRVTCYFASICAMSFWLVAASATNARYPCNCPQILKYSHVELLMIVVSEGGCEVGHRVGCLSHCYSLSSPSSGPGSKY